MLVLTCRAVLWGGDKKLLQRTVINPSQQKFFSVVVEMTLGLATAYENGGL